MPAQRTITPLDGSELVDPAYLGTGTPDGTKFLRDDQTYQVPGAGSYGPANADYLVGTADAGLSAEIVVGTSPGGELGGTWASPTIDSTHSGSSHAGVISTHEAASDPHTGYRLESADHSHASTGLQAGTVAHSVLTGLTSGDDHTQYQKESEKDAANGYAGLNASSIVPIARLATGTPDGTKFLRDDNTLGIPSGTGAPTDADYLVGTASGGLSAEIVVGTTPNGELGGTWGAITVDNAHAVTTGQSSQHARGQAAYAFPWGVHHSSTYTAANLVANGGSRATQILVPAVMYLDTVSVWCTDTATARTWGWDLYYQNDPASATCTRVANSNADSTFTPSAASIRSIVAASAPVLLQPGVYWLVIQDRHASNTFGLGIVTAGSLAVNVAQSKTTTNPNGATLDLSTGWARVTSQIGVVLIGRVFNEGAPF
jgi:hypothetical protein